MLLEVERRHVGQVLCRERGGVEAAVATHKGHHLLLRQATPTYLGLSLVSYHPLQLVLMHFIPDLNNIPLLSTVAHILPLKILRIVSPVTFYMC